MSLLPISDYFIFNGILNSVEDFIPDENEGGVYEVLRVLKGVPLFLEEHLNRFYYSARLADKTIRFSDNEIKRFIEKLILKNRVEEGNILLSCKINLKVFFIPHKYPEPSLFQTGISCGIVKAERLNPNAKVFQTSVRQLANKLIEEKGFYEVILIDKTERITEGSRSNIFFIKERNIYTPPANEVLLGVTRQKTLALAAELHLKSCERDIYLHELSGFDGAFITGTSPNILPVKNIDRFYYNPLNQHITDLMDKYEKLILSEIEKAAS